MRNVYLVFLSFCFSLLQVWGAPAQLSEANPSPDTPPRGSNFQHLLPASIQQEVITLTAQDGASSWGILYTPKGKMPQTAVLDMHPRISRSRHYFIPPLLEAGFAVLGQNNRYLNNDRSGIHERMLLDMAAGMSFLKSRGFEKIVLLGASGGGSLIVFYQAQAATAPPGRVSSTPAGDPPNLNEFDLPPADGVMTVIHHLGEGEILEARIDPSVIQEEDPLSIDPSLDMYNPANGFRMPPETTTYSKEFIALYWAAQRARMERLDQWARALIAQQNHYKALMKQPDFKNLPWEQQQWIERNALTERHMTVYRTWADLRYMDLSIDPSDRIVGDNSGTTPWLSNYSLSPTPNYISPRAFLSSRSSLSSNAVSVKSMRQVKVPFLIVQGTAHRAIYPSDTKAILAAAATKDKTVAWIVGADIYFRPSGPKSGKGDQLQQTMHTLVSWMRERFPH